ncbi:MAG: inorganic diphosphatase [Proteobacteria bacterium]|nr:inorganic diphosphatase [Pseudomonadota bacterium]
MNYSSISYGNAESGEFNVIIEITPSSGPVKYEFDKDLQMMIVDRFISVPMHYPANYGFIPKTLSGDGDPVDVLVHTSHPIIPGSLIVTRPIGVLLTQDEKGEDAKILALPIKKLDSSFDDVEEYNDMPHTLISQIEHFFTHYKDLEKNKWASIIGWRGKADAMQIIKEGIKNYS